MRGWRFIATGADAELAELDLAEPAVAGAEVLVAVSRAVVDGSAGDHAAGTSAVGVVTAAGDDARHWLGRRVMVPDSDGCGECDVCRRGAVAACPRGVRRGVDGHGTLAERTWARARWLCPLGDGLELDDELAAICAGPALRAYTLYARTGLGPGETTVILGDGPEARLLERIGRARGAIVAEAADPAAAERPARWFVTEAGGLARAMSGLAAGSTLTLLDGAGSTAIDAGVLAARHATLIGVAGGHPDLLPELAAMVVKGELSLAGSGARTMAPS